MNNIPLKLRKEMADDPFYTRCVVTGVGGKIEWHHNLIVSGNQLQRKWAILPLAPMVHAKADNTEVREILDWIMLNRASQRELGEFGMATYGRLVYLRQRLNEKFLGPWRRGIYKSYYAIKKL